ncbi:MAG: tRNA (cytidine(34)-2'-O)-methyltransferase [Parvularculaceae bacterium]|nr:tRNA (cytidine(34)-2'-O)-methyltransferase [Parvularculaceae bacterium]
MRLVLFQPDIPQNTGAALRVAACFGVGLDIVGPTGFPLDARDLRRAALDYGDLVAPVLHAGWSAFLASPERATGRLVLLTTAGAVLHSTFAFAETDLLLLGRESAGAPPEVHAAAEARIVIPMATGARSLNVAVAAAVALAEARRQIGFPK